MVWQQNLFFCKLFAVFHRTLYSTNNDGRHETDDDDNPDDEVGPESTDVVLDTEGEEKEGEEPDSDPEGPGGGAHLLPVIGSVPEVQVNAILLCVGIGIDAADAAAATADAGTRACEDAIASANFFLICRCGQIITK